MDDARGAAGAATIDVGAEGGRAVVRVAGELNLATTPPLWARTDAVATAVRGLPVTARPSEAATAGGAAAAAGGSAVEIDVSRVPQCDFAGATYLVALRRRLTAGGSDAAWSGAGPQVASLLALVEDAERIPPATGATPPDDELFEKVGERAWRIALGVRDTMDYVGHVTSALGAALTRPGTVRGRDVVLYMGRAGADALPIVALISFLIGVILAFQSVNLLGKLGFSGYTPDAVAVSVILELGPLMTAVIVAGRSGSAFAAEIGTMKVNEEVDALDTMGLDRTQFLVVPKIIALCAMMPLLVVFADACGLIGGCAIGVATLDMTVAQYFQRSFAHVDLWGATQGLIKGEAYALDIAAVGCLRGLQTQQGAQGVGLSATSAVVSSIFLIIVTDAVLTVIFTYVHP